MMASIIHTIPTAIMHSILLSGLLWCFYKLILSYINWSAQIRYILSTGLTIFSAVFFILELGCFHLFKFNTAPILAKSIYRIQLLEAPTRIGISISIVYIILLVYFLFKLIRQVVSINKLISESDFTKNDSFQLLIQDSLGNNLKNIKIGTHPSIVTPMVFGIVESVILLPVSICNNITPQQLKYILVHELAHILRNDYYINLIVELAATLLWFNPFIYLFKKEIQLQREMVCDEFVVANLKDPIYYSKTLMNLASHSLTPKIKLSMAAFAGKNELYTRIEHINGVQKKSVSKLPFLIGFMLFTFLLVSPYLLFNQFGFKNNLNNNQVNTPVRFEKLNISLVGKSNFETLPKKIKHLKSTRLKNPNKAFASNTNKNLLVPDILQDSAVPLNNNSMDLSYTDLVNQTKNWIKEHENNVQYAKYDELNNSKDKKETAEEDLANTILLLSIIKNYQLKKSILTQKMKNASDINEARDYILNSQEWNDIVQYEKWAKEFLNRQ